jgi:hypothetical protein
MKTSNPIKTENIIGNAGRPVKNQYIITTPEGRFFQSYQTVIAFISNDGEVTMNEVYDHSHTTGTYRNIFLGDSGVNETRAKVKSGEYKVANLNA